MPNRKKPFSNKQKKLQIQEKRERKKHQEDDTNEEDSDVDSDTLEESVILSSESALDGKSAVLPVPVAKFNQQPSSRDGGRGRPNTKSEYDPNRYRLHFYRESKDEIKARKDLAALPIQPVPETSLEMSLQDIYQPGSELDMPKRPPWDYSMTKEDLDKQEQKYFRDYVEKIFTAHKDSENLSYFELNLETWRQLWRVMEMSDVFLVIVDLRFPVLHFPPTLYKYITGDLNKPMILILNKIDFVPPGLAIAWKKYFESTYPSLKVVLFGSAPRAATADAEVTFKKKKPTKRSKFRVCFGAKEIFDICTDLTKGKVDMKQWKNRLDANEQGKDLPGNSPIIPPDNRDRHGPHEFFKDGTLTIGCIGEPNVGKSSVINALMGQKVVSVSKTPGHTKHFQTIFLAPNVKLCDCPGLVFPATAPKVLQILGGIYPISQVSDPYNVVGYLAARTPIIRLLKLKHPDEDNKNGQYSALDICEAWAMKRGFFTAKAARPDIYRAANHLLRITLEGRICLRMYPPGYTKNKSSFEKMDETKELSKKLAEMESRVSGKRDDSANEESEGSLSDEDDDDEQDDAVREGDHESKRHFERLAGNNKFAALGAALE